MSWVLAVTACMGIKCSVFELGQNFKSKQECLSAATETGQIIWRRKEPWDKFDNVTVICSQHAKGE